MVAVVVGSSLLAGCVGLFPESGRFEDPSGLQRNDGQISFLLCETGEVSLALLEERNTDEGRDWVTIVQAEGDALITSGVPYSQDSLPGGLFASINTTAVLDPGADYYLLVQTSEGTIRAAFTAPDGLPTNGWLAPDGTVTADPCE